VRIIHTRSTGYAAPWSRFELEKVAVGLKAVLDADSSPWLVPKPSGEAMVNRVFQSSNCRAGSARTGPVTSLIVWHFHARNPSSSASVSLRATEFGSNFGSECARDVLCSTDFRRACQRRGGSQALSPLSSSLAAAKRPPRHSSAQHSAASRFLAPPLNELIPPVRAVILQLGRAKGIGIVVKAVE